MKITIAKTAGFCMGVRRAVEMALDAANKQKQLVYTYGPLIHNPQVLSILEEKGITILENIPEKGVGTVLIRAHGVPPSAEKSLVQAGYKVVNATCPRVIKVQTIIARHAKLGYASIIIGDEDHPEVTGLLGYAGDNGYVADSLEKLEALQPFEKAIIVAQTTQNIRFYKVVKQWAAQKYPHYKVFETICDSTEKRQSEAHQIAESVDAVVVVGGYNSGNTKRLAEIVRDSGKPSFHIEDDAGLDNRALESVRNIGITAGASTPNWIIKKVYRRIEILPHKNRHIWLRIFFSLQRILITTNFYVAIGAACLSYASVRLLELEYHVSYTLIAFFYILSMHTFNNLTEVNSARYNEPDRASFYHRFRIPMIIMAVISSFGGIGTALNLGVMPFLVLLAMSILGFLYSYRLVPSSYLGSRLKIIRNIPGSKTVLIALAWGIVMSAAPAVTAHGKVNLNTILVSLWISGMVFVRTALFDILDIQGDRIVGKETIPIYIGEQKTRLLLEYILLFLFIVLFPATVFNIISPLGYVFGIYPIYMFAILKACEKQSMFPGVRIGFLIESGFFLAGIITWVWSFFYF